MKKILSFLIGVTLSGLCSAQLQNGNFENWNSLSASGPDGWINSNMEASQRGYTANVTQYTPAHGGNYAVKIETKSNGTDTLMGYVFDTHYQGDPFSGKGGVPYTMKPDSFICHAKLGILSGDTGFIGIMYKRNDTIIGMDMFKIAGNNPAVWQRLAFKLSLSSIPDTVIILATCSNAMTKTGIQPGSFVVFDDFAFNTSLPIPDGGFENWSTMFNYETPAGWDCSNALNFMMNGMGTPLQKTTDKFEGQYALQMKTVGRDSNSIFNYLNNGFWSHAVNGYTGGTSFINQIDTLIGWYKYMPKAGDMARINIEYKKNGILLSNNSSLSLSASSSFTKFEIPINLPLAPDTAIITINSSDWPVTMADTGSILIIDAMNYKSSMFVGIQNFFANTSVLIGPNPTNGEIAIFYIAKNAGTAFYNLFDETGKVIKSEMLNAMKTSLNISEYTKGVYFIRIHDGKNIISRKLVLQ